MAVGQAEGAGEDAEGERPYEMDHKKLDVCPTYQEALRDGFEDSEARV